jgi:hypothetical protein
MDDERQPPGPPQAMTDDAFTIDAGPRRPRQPPARLASHLARQEATAIRGGHSTRRAGTTIPRAPAGTSPGICEQALSQLPAPARLLCRTIRLPRYARTTPPP